MAAGCSQHEHARSTAPSNQCLTASALPPAIPSAPSAVYTVQNYTISRNKFDNNIIINNNNNTAITRVGLYHNTTQPYMHFLLPYAASR